MSELLKERICSFESWPISKGYLIQRNKQEFMQINICYFQKRGEGGGGGGGIRAGVFDRVTTIWGTDWFWNISLGGSI